VSDDQVMREFFESLYAKEPGGPVGPIEAISITGISEEGKALFYKQLEQDFGE